MFTLTHLQGGSPFEQALHIAFHFLQGLASQGVFIADGLGFMSSQAGEPVIAQMQCKADQT